MRPRLAELEGSGLEARSAELLVVLAWLVARDIGIDEDDLNAARRRAMFVLADADVPSDEPRQHDEQLRGARLEPGSLELREPRAHQSS